MKKSQIITRGAIVCALYIALTLPLGQLAVQPFIQIRPAEGLTLLPLIFPSAVFGLAIGCFLVNLLTSSIIDAVIGGAITLLAGYLTMKVKNVWIGGIFPVVLNALFLPIVFILLDYGVAYWYTVAQIFISQSIWVYGLGVPLYKLTKNTAKKQNWQLY